MPTEPSPLSLEFVSCLDATGDAIFGCGRVLDLEGSGKGGNAQSRLRTSGEGGLGSGEVTVRSDLRKGDLFPAENGLYLELLLAGVSGSGRKKGRSRYSISSSSIIKEISRTYSLLKGQFGVNLISRLSVKQSPAQVQHLETGARRELDPQDLEAARQAKLRETVSKLTDNCTPHKAYSLTLWHLNTDMLRHRRYLNFSIAIRAFYSGQKARHVRHCGFCPARRSHKHAMLDCTTIK